jgi:hypothetical protein
MNMKVQSSRKSVGLKKISRYLIFECWTILRPSTFMDNFFSRVAGLQFPYPRKEHLLVTNLNANFCKATLCVPFMHYIYNYGLE